MRLCALLWIPLLFTALTAVAQDRPASLVLNGGYERTGGWSKPASAQIVETGRAGRALMFDGEGGSSQEVMPGGAGNTFSCSVEMRTEDIQGQGYAYAAIYQLNAAGDWVEFKDFAQVRGTQDWTRYDYTFSLVPGAEMISVRCGIYAAGGKAWFDNWTLVAGPRAFGFGEVSAGAAGARRENAIAILRQPDMPVRGAASSPARLGQLLSGSGFTVSFLDAEQLASPAQLNSEQFGIVVLPYGQSFPAKARENFTRFLRSGGHFISTGGYAFENLLVRDGDTWLPEAQALNKALEEALGRSVLPDGGFESSRDAPVGGMELDGKWRRDGDVCTISDENPREGAFCAKIAVTPQEPREDRWYLDIAPKRGARYRVSGWVRTEEVQPLGNGFAYLALYEYGDANKLGKWKDFAVVRGTTDWQQFQYDFSPAASTTRLHLKAGLYRATGTAWFDDIRLADITGTDPRPMNTSTGDPKDGLQLAPSQIGVFDASYPLRRASELRAGQEQFIVEPECRMRGEMSGWVAAGVQGYDNARWVELLDSRDRFGRKRGAAGALMVNYNGFYAGSMWGYFGVENRDLFDGASPELDRALVKLARFMSQGLFLHNLRTDLASYKDGEPVKLSVETENWGGDAQDCRVVFRLEPQGSGEAQELEATLTVGPGESGKAEATFAPETFAADLYRITATLITGDAPVDRMVGGFIVQRDTVAASGPELRFHDNYFHLNGEPIFLFGSDTYAYTYNSAHENPYAWMQEHTAARDYGFEVYENLQFSRPGWVFRPEDWRQFEGMAQSCQRAGLVFMPCQLVGHNVAISEEDLEKQALQCEAYGETMRKYPGLLYYLNGDFFMKFDDTEALKRLWNQWLADKYGSADALRASWGDEVYGDWGELRFPPPAPGGWGSVRECDRMRFEVWLTKRWVERHVKAVRGKDTDHPITSEYYQRPYGGLDLILTIDGQDASNIGYFDRPYEDVNKLPLTLRLIDLRMRGKSLGLGEYGVKTHPAWTIDNGAGGYHPVRTEEEQKRLFMAVAHYGFGMGGCKVQNWCLRDASEWVFPWGVLYPNGYLPKDVAYWHRNLSLVLRHLRPVYQAPEVAVLLPDNLRLGSHAQVGVEVAHNAFRALLSLKTEFNVINEHHVDALGADTKVLLWPSPFCPDDAAYEKVLNWVGAGGRLLVTGDLSLNWDRKRTRQRRLEELCGVEFVREVYLPPNRDAQPGQGLRGLPEDWQAKPCVAVRSAGATELVTTETGDPVVFTNQVGAGMVYYCTDPLELGAPDAVFEQLRALYCVAVRGSGPPEPWDGVHIARQPLRSGGQFVMAFNTEMPPGAKQVTLPAGDADVQVRLANRYPAFTATRGEQILVGVGCSGEATFDSAPLISGEAQVACLSLDGKALPLSEAVLLCPFSDGATRFHSRLPADEMVTVVGDIIDGRWVTYETHPGKTEINLTEDTMTCLIVICKAGQVERWADAVEEAMREPWSTPGY